MNEERTLLLIGASGFAGTHLRQAAESWGMRVIGASRSGGRGDLACDLLDRRSIETALGHARPHMVVNMAGGASVAASWRRPAETFAINAAGVLNLLEALASRAPKAHLLCVSSSEVYGEVAPERLPLREEEPLRPSSPYGSSKAAMEILCAQYARSHGLRIALVRTFNQIGPGQSEHFVGSALARQLAAAELRGTGEIELAVGNLSAARDFTDVRDSARAYRTIAERGLIGTYNLCSGNALRIESLIEMMGAATGLKVGAAPDPTLARPKDVPIVYGSPERLEGETGWRPEIPLQRTVADLVKWWRAELSRSEHQDLTRLVRSDTRVQ